MYTRRWKEKGSGGEFDVGSKGERNGGESGLDKRARERTVSSSSVWRGGWVT